MRINKKWRLHMAGTLLFLCGVQGCTTCVMPQEGPALSKPAAACASSQGAPMQMSAPMRNSNPAVGSLGLVDPPSVCLRSDRNERDDAKAALLYINHINYVIAKLNDMSDLVALQQEYENLTDDNLNLETIRDETTLQLILQLLEQLKNLQGASVRSLQAQVTLEKEKKDAIWKALPQPAFLVVSKSPVTIALAVAGAALTSAQNYYNAKANAETAYAKLMLENAEKKLAYINEINKELFYAQWRLMRDYSISDGARVTREEARLFLGFAKLLKGASHAKDFNRNQTVAEIFRNHEHEMQYLPFYWMTRASTSNAIGDYDDLQESCRRYFGLYQGAPIVRRDMDACSMALLYVSSALKRAQGSGALDELDEKQIRKWLEFVLSTVRIPHWETKFAVAMLYRKIGDRDRAKEILGMTLSEVYACVKVWEESGGHENIFRKTSALEKAFKDVDFTKDWPDWKGKDGVASLVPYTGFVWVAGALHSMGETDIFSRYAVDRAKYSVAERYITGAANKASPKISRSGAALRVESNGLWEPTAGAVKVFMDGRECSRNSKSADLSRVSFDVPVDGKELLISVRTEMGIVATYVYEDLSKLDKPSDVRVVFPWDL